MVEGGDAAVVPAHISGLQETRVVHDEVLIRTFIKAYSTCTVKLREGRLAGC